MTMVLATYLVVTASLLGLIYWLFMSSYSQFFGEYPYKGVSSNKVIALTFDDGPNEPYTSQIVDFLNSRNVRATFFEVGVCIERYPQVTKKIVKSGHVIGSHSLSHEFHKYLLSLRLQKEITANQAIIRKYTGKTPALYRSPWLWRQPWLLQTLKENSLHPVSGVFCHALEVLQPNAKRIARKAVAKAKSGTILIFHDGVEGRGGNRKQTVEAVKITVDTLIKRGFIFVTVDKLLNVSAYQKAPKNTEL